MKIEITEKILQKPSKGVRAKKSWHFRVRAKNGKILCASEVYGSARAVHRAIEVLRKEMATVQLVTIVEENHAA